MKTQPPALRLAFDCVIFTVLDRKLHVALGRRQPVNEVGQPDPFPNALSLPGGYVRDDEAIKDTIRRRLLPETGLELEPEQCAIFDHPLRDTRHRVVSIAYTILIKGSQAAHFRWGLGYTGGSWEPVNNIPKGVWAFDHREIFYAALSYLKNKARREPTGFELLPAKFDIRELHALQEQIRQEPIDIRNFRRAMLRSHLIVEAGVEKGGPGLPKKLYRLNQPVFRRLKDRGFAAA